MGHTRLGNIPTGKKWKAVVAALAASGDNTVTFGILSEDVELVALRTLEAAKTGLDRALDDEGLKYTFFVLTQLALASRETDWKKRLSQVGIELPEETSPFALSAELHKSIDDYLRTRGHESDISEIAQQAAGEALTSLTAEEARSYSAPVKKSYSMRFAVYLLRGVLLTLDKNSLAGLWLDF